MTVNLIYDSPPIFCVPRFQPLSPLKFLPFTGDIFCVNTTQPRLDVPLCQSFLSIFTIYIRANCMEGE